jgi:hypothetical protein
MVVVVVVVAVAGVAASALDLLAQVPPSWWRSAWDMAACIDEPPGVARHSQVVVSQQQFHQLLGSAQGRVVAEVAGGIDRLRGDPEPEQLNGFLSVGNSRFCADCRHQEGGRRREKRQRQQPRRGSSPASGDACDVHARIINLRLRAVPQPKTRQEEVRRCLQASCQLPPAPARIQRDRRHDIQLSRSRRPTGWRARRDGDRTCPPARQAQQQQLLRPGKWHHWCSIPPAPASGLVASSRGPSS